MRLLRIIAALWAISLVAAEPLRGTGPLTADGDLAAQMVAGIDKYLMHELASSVENRKQYWKPDFSSPEAYAKSVQPNRERLKRILGIVDHRISPVEMRYTAATEQPSLVAESNLYRVHAVRWPVFEGVEGEGLLLEPGGKVIANVIALPDADWTPEMLVGLAPGVPRESQFARRLAENGCRVLVPVLIDRKETWSGSEKLGRWTNQPHREFIYRMAYQMGRHVIGYELQKVFAAVDWFAREKGHAPIGVLGYGEGGMLALYGGAIDTRIAIVGVAGHFGPREAVWQEPIYRNVWRLLSEFGDAEVLALVAPRATCMDVGRYVQCSTPEPSKGRGGAAPGSLRRPALVEVLGEVKRHHALIAPIKDQPSNNYGAAAAAFGVETPLIQEKTLRAFVEHLQGVAPESLKLVVGDPPADARKQFDPAARQKRQFDQLVAFTQRIMRDSEARRAETFWSKIDTSSLEKFQASTAPFRKLLDEEVIGKLPTPTEKMNPRTRLLHDTPKWKSYEVTLDLYPNVFAYGILCVPKDLKPGERRPVVVCQHGLEGRPTDVVNPKERTKYYNSFGSELADRGYVVFAPQNPYIGRDNFRVLQRKANPLGLSIFSFIVRQHERILDWLATQPFVDEQRMAFYGLSYGGKTAMRVPALLPRYCLSICSGDFNEWTWKNVSVDYRGSYMFTMEYEMPEFNMGSTLVYAEMASLIAPRPFMVERGHDDGVGIDEWIAYEYAKVRRLYSRLKISDRTTLQFFAGGHEINGKGTFEFLDKHLKWDGKQ